MPSVYIPNEIRQFVIDRAYGRCEYCQCRADYATETFPIDHIIALSRGGTNEHDNLALACSKCNGHKYNKLEAPDPITGEIVPLYNPRDHKWEEHFGWSKDYTHVVGLTAIGRSTVATLQMNHVGSVNLREALYLIGKHPPKRSE